MAKFNDAIKYFQLFPNLKFNAYSSQDKFTQEKEDFVSSPFFLHSFSYTSCHFDEMRPLLPLCCFPWSRHRGLPPLPAGLECHPVWLQHFSHWPLLHICSWGLTCSSTDPWRLYFLVKTKQRNRDESWKWADDHKREENLILCKEKKNSQHSMKAHLLWSSGQKHIKNTNKNHPKVVL